MNKNQRKLVQFCHNSYRIKIKFIIIKNKKIMTYSKSNIQRRRLVRSSKISVALKKNLYDSIIQDKLSIRKAALKFNINYSTAKIIYHRVNKQLGQAIISTQHKGRTKTIQMIRRRKNLQKLEAYRCSYLNLEQQYSVQNNNLKSNKIEIITTAGWNFMLYKIPK